MGSVYINYSLDTTKPVEAIGTPKKSKALSTNISKLKRFYIMLTSYVGIDEIQRIKTLDNLIAYMNTKKEELEAKREEKLKKLDRKYYGKITSESLVSDKATKLYNIHEEKVDKLNKSIDDSIKKYDEKIEQYEKRKEHLEDPSFKIDYDVVSNPTSEINYPSNPNFTPIDEKRIESELAQQQEEIKQAIKQISDEDSSNNLEEPIQLDNDAEQSLPESQPESEKSEIEKLTESFKEEIEILKANFKEELYKNVEEKITEFSKMYNNFYNQKITMMADKTSELLNESGKRLEKSEQEKQQIKEEKDNVIKSQNEEIDSLKKQLEETNIKLSNSEQEKQQLKEEKADLSEQLEGANTKLSNSEQEKQQLKEEKDNREKELLLEIQQSKQTIEGFNRMVQKLATSYSPVNVDQQSVEPIPEEIPKTK